MARNAFKNPKSTTGTFPFVPKNTVTRHRRDQPLKSTRGKESPKLLTIFQIQSLIEKLSLPDTDQISSNSLCKWGDYKAKSKCAFFFSLDDLSRNISLYNSRSRFWFDYFQRNEMQWKSSRFKGRVHRRVSNKSNRKPPGWSSASKCCSQLMPFPEGEFPQSGNTKLRPGRAAELCKVVQSHKSFFRQVCQKPNWDSRPWPGNQ